MYKEQLAIASIPCQEWGVVYPDKQALKEGTIFEDLNKPFFATDSVLQTGKKEDSYTDGEHEITKKIYETSFVLDDLTLYLDTHPEDNEALKLYMEKSRERTELKKEFAEKFYPLTRDCIFMCNKTGAAFSWQDGPCPWEGVSV